MAWAGAAGDPRDHTLFCHQPGFGDPWALLWEALLEEMCRRCYWLLVVARAPQNVVIWIFRAWYLN